MQRPVEKRVRSDENILPLINVVFLLLIFFMVAGRMTDRPELAAIPPDAALGKTLDGEVTLVLASDGRLAWQGEPIAGDELTAKARQWTGRTIVLRADGRVAHATVMRRVVELREAGVREVVLVTRKRS